jgi:ribosome-binding factor A
MDRESTRQKKVGRQIQRDLGGIFREVSQELFGGKMITVTRVRMSPDLMLARVYLSVFPPVGQETFDALVNVHKKEIRYRLGRLLRNQLRAIPELAFFLDDSLDYIDKIDDLLKK